MPFPRNPDFVGRTDDLESLHAALQKRGPVGIRPAGLTGMGGIGKTQLAVEYVYRHGGDYPGGIFWVDAAQPLAQGLAQLGGWLRPDVLDQSPDRQLRATFEELSRRPDALVVLDNLDDPAQLTPPLGSVPSPLTLACRILFTTRQRDLGPFHPVEVSVLPEGPALQLLLRHECRHAVRDDPDHPERGEAEAICRLLGWLPLALELASAFLGEWPDIVLAAYRRRLQDEGCLPTLDTEVANLAAVNFQPIHAAAMAATLKAQWDALKQGDDTARLLFRVAGQFPEATAIPTNALGLFAGVSHTHKPGHPSPLGRALKRLHDARLVEELHVDRVRLHPLVREFAAGLIPPSETPGFRRDCARRVERAFEDFATLEDVTRADGVDMLQQTLLTALDFLAGGEDEPAETLHAMLRMFRRESHTLREWDPERQPNYLAQQVHYRAVTWGEMALATQAERRLNELGRPALVVRWQTVRESPALVQLLAGHQGAVTSVAVSPDGRYVVTGSDDATAAVWDLQTGQRLRELAGHQGAVTSVAVSPDGRHVISGSSDRTMAVWDLQTGQRLRELAGHQGAVTSVAVSPDGRHVISGSSDRTMAVWDLQTGQRLRVLTGHQGAVTSVAVSPDGRHVISGSSDRTMAVWDLQTGQRLRELAGHQGAVTSVAVSPDGRHVVTGSDDATAAVWDLQTGQRLRVLTGHQGAVTSVAVNGDGRLLAVSASYDGTVAVWDLATGQRLRQLSRHRGWAAAVAMTNDGRLAVSSYSNDQTVPVWDLQFGGRPHELPENRRSLMCGAVSGDGRLAVSGFWDKTVAVWDSHTGQQLYELTGHRGAVRSVAVSGDGRLAVSGSDDWTVVVWDLQAGQRLRQLTTLGPVTSVAVSGDGRLAVSGSAEPYSGVDPIVAVWDVQSGQRLRELAGHRGLVTSVAVTGEDRLAVSASLDETVAVWDLHTGQRLRELTGHRGAVRSVAASGDGRVAVSGSDDGTVAVWDLQTGQRLHEFAGHRSRVNSVAVVSDGRLAASGSEDQTIAVWDPCTGQPLTIVSLEGPIQCLDWSADGRFLIAGDGDGSLYRLEYRER